MKRSLAVLGALLLFAAGAIGQFQPTQLQQQSLLHRVAGLYYSAGYNTWQAYAISSTPSGSGVLIFATSNASGTVTLADGSQIPLTSVFNTNTPITIADANSETVTPTAVSIGGCGAGNLGVGGSNICATVSATFSNPHGQGALAVSGDQGIFEAITDAQANGGGLVYWVADTGIVTLNTGGLTTTTTTKVPSNFISAGASARVTTTITTSTNWAVGISGTTSAFCTANATLTAGTTCLANMNSPATVGTSQALTAILFTVTGANAGAGAIKARVWGFTAAQPSS